MRVDSPSPNKLMSALNGKRELERNLEHITQEMYRRNKELAETNKTLSLLRAIDSIALQHHDDLTSVCGKIADTILQASGYPFVGIFVQPEEAPGAMYLTGWSAKEGGPNAPLGLTRPLRLEAAAGWFANAEPNLQLDIAAIPQEMFAKIAHMTGTEARRLCVAQSIASLYMVKLTTRDKLVGMLVAGFTEPAEQVAAFDKVLLDQLSEGIGLALDNKLLIEENERVVHQLKLSNAKLRELDETKDDFISMASHQLRTPLTSIKGYLSMVLDGDAGKLAPTQQKMLSQAFTSSQRMVFLITDLLNVSRLKTGKFVIDAVPTDLSEMIRSEVDQLSNAAAAKQLELIYKKPANFPKLMLDETKTRQVIMNYIDNAIYYTPAGGYIRVELDDKPSTVELRVVDTGIGVPRLEQHRLFTKFYRAANARKARPDGTGLGLFMAKKVVLAEGGSIIFSSKEGRGSTFGFVFPKAKLKVPDELPPAPTGPAKHAVSIRDTAHA